MMADTVATASQTLTTVTPEIHKVAPISGFVNVWGFEINPSVMVLVLVLAGVIFMLWKGQRDGGKNTFDFWDLIMDTLPDKTRRASGIKTSYQVAFIMSSWVVVDQEIKGTLSEGIFMAYLGVWCASLIAKVIFDKTEPPSLAKKDG